MPSFCTLFCALRPPPEVAGELWSDFAWFPPGDDRVEPERQHVTLIGLGAFVTQWLLKQPLARAMTMEYAVTGSWDDPKIEPIESGGKPVAADKQTKRPETPGKLEDFLGN